MADKILGVVEFYSGIGGMHFALKGMCNKLEDVSLRPPYIHQYTLYIIHYNRRKILPVTGQKTFLSFHSSIGHVLSRTQHPLVQKMIQNVLLVNLLPKQ